MEISESFLLEALDSLKREILSALHVAMPGNVVDYDASAGLATVQPALRRKAASGAVVTAPLLREVQVLLPSGSHTVSPGDPCILLFQDFCPDGWLESGQPALPPSPRQHDLSDAVALVGFFPGLQAKD